MRCLDIRGLRACVVKASSTRRRTHLQVCGAAFLHVRIPKSWKDSYASNSTSVPCQNYCAPARKTKKTTNCSVSNLLNILQKSWKSPEQGVPGALSNLQSPQTLSADPGKSSPNPTSLLAPGEPFAVPARHWSQAVASACCWDLAHVSGDKDLM